MGNHALWQVEEIELDREFEISNVKFDVFGRGCSSVGRAVALQAIGQEFESPQLHQPTLEAQLRAGCRAVAKRRRAMSCTITKSLRASARQAGFCGRVAQLVRARA